MHLSLSLKRSVSSSTVFFSQKRKKKTIEKKCLEIQSHININIKPKPTIQNVLIIYPNGVGLLVKADISGQSVELNRRHFLFYGSWRGSYSR